MRLGSSRVHNFYNTFPAFMSTCERKYRKMNGADVQKLVFKKH